MWISDSQKQAKKRRAVSSENASSTSSSPGKRHLNMLISPNLTSSQLENGSSRTSGSSAQSSVPPSRKSSRVSQPTPKRKAMMPPQENTTTENESDKTPPPSISIGLKRKISARKVEKSPSTLLKPSDSQGAVLELSSDSDNTPKRPTKRAKLKHKGPLPKDVIELSDDEASPKTVNMKSSPAKRLPRSTQSRKTVTRPKPKKNKPNSRPLPEEIIEIPSTDDEAPAPPPKTPVPLPPEPVLSASKSNGRQSRPTTNSSSKTSSSSASAGVSAPTSLPTLQPIVPEPVIAPISTNPSFPSPLATTEEIATSVSETPPAMDVDPVATDAMDDLCLQLQFTPSPSPPELGVERTGSFATLPPLSPSPEPHLPTPTLTISAMPEPIMIDLDSPSPGPFDEVDEAHTKSRATPEELTQEQVEDSPFPEPFEEVTGPMMLTQEHLDEALNSARALSKPPSDSEAGPSSAQASAPSALQHTSADNLTFSFRKYAKNELYARDEEIVPPRVLWTDLVFQNAMNILSEKRRRAKEAEQEKEKRRLEGLEKRKGKEKVKEVEMVSMDSLQSDDGMKIDTPEAPGNETQENQLATTVEALEYVAIAGEPSPYISMTEVQSAPLALLDRGHEDEAQIQASHSQDLDVEMVSQTIPEVREDARALVLKVLKLNALETYANILGASREAVRLPVSSPPELPTIPSSLEPVACPATVQPRVSVVPPTSIRAHLPIENDAVTLAKSQHIALVFLQITALSTPIDTFQPTEQASFEPAMEPESDSEQPSSPIPPEKATDGSEPLPQVQIKAATVDEIHEEASDIRLSPGPSMLAPTRISPAQTKSLLSPDLSMSYSSTSGSSDTTDDSVRLATPPPIEPLPKDTGTKELIYAFDVSVFNTDLTLDKLRECRRNGFSQYDLSGDIDDYTFPDWS